MNELFPIFLKADQIEILIVGGGNVGFEKLGALFSNSPNANVTLIAPLVKDEIVTLAALHPTLTIEKRKFADSDLDNKQLVICATDDKELHKLIFTQCKSRKILINVADTPDLCDFYLGSIVKKGDLKIAISSNGKSPTFAKRLKEILNDALPSDDINELLETLNSFREKLKGDFNEKLKALNELTKSLKSP